MGVPLANDHFAISKLDTQSGIEVGECFSEVDIAFGFVGLLFFYDVRDLD